MFGLVVGAAASFALVFAEPICAFAAATTALGVGHTTGTIGGQSIMAQAESSFARIGRFGALTTVSALGQIVGPVVGGVIIGHSEKPDRPIDVVGAAGSRVGVRRGLPAA